MPATCLRVRRRGCASAWFRRPGAGRFLTAASSGEIAFDVARFELDVLIFDITTPFKLALSAPREAGQIEFGGDLLVSSAVETFASAAPVVVDDFPVLDNTRLRSLDAGARIASVRGGVRFSDNALLTGIAPFTLGGSLQLINNARLSSADRRGAVRYRQQSEVAKL